MNILILHNNNIPIELRKPFKLMGNDYYTEVIRYSTNEHADFDTFICNKLSVIFNEKLYDVIIIPYTLGEENYLEYSGLCIASHIRLTKDWYQYTTPIIFIGIDDILHIMRLSNYGGILSTYRIYTSNARTKEELANKIRNINIGKNDIKFNDWLTSTECQNILNRINIKAPANYATHHSIANKWAVLRWIEMFSWNSITPEFDDVRFINMLYTKYLLAQAGNRESFTNKHKEKNPKDPIIKKYEYQDNLKRKRIVYIDDEEALWNKVLTPIFENSNIDFIPYHFDMQNKIEKHILIKDIESFLLKDYNDNGGADCYLIDLRLHDDDFSAKIKSKDLSGQQIARYIKRKECNEQGEKVGLNEGCQIVIFTASNKSWNIEESMINIGACGYAIKESPEFNYTRNESYQLFCNFSQKIIKAFDLSFLQQLYKTLDDLYLTLKGKGIDIASLYDFVNLLDLNKENNTKRSCIIKSAALHQYVFLENLIDKVLDFKVEASGKITKRGVTVGQTSHSILFEIQKDNKYNSVINIKYIPENRTKSNFEPMLQPWIYLEDRLPSPKNPMNKEKPFDFMIAALLIYYGIKESDVKKTVLLGYERNMSIAHGNRETSITQNDLLDHFYNVIVPILKKESEN